MIKASHEAVMVNEVLENLVFEQNGEYVDCTFGAGGHSLEILKKISESGTLISIDKDEKATVNLSADFTNDKRFRFLLTCFSIFGRNTFITIFSSLSFKK